MLNSQTTLNLKSAQPTNLNVERVEMESVSHLALREVEAREIVQMKTLSNWALHEKVQDLVGDERELLVVIVQHLQEIDQRRLWAEMAFPSLYEYCRQSLKFRISSVPENLCLTPHE